MRIVIVGDGKLGTTLAEFISNEGHDVVVVDTNPHVVEQTVNHFDVMGVIGNGASYQIQKEAGVDKADLLIAATSSDELNIMCCMVAKKVGARHTIARVRNPDYAEQLMFLKSELGLSMIVNPEYDAAYEISRILQFPSAMKVEKFARGRVDLVEIMLTEDHPLCGKQLCDLTTTYSVDVLVCAVSRNGEAIIPTGDFCLQCGDKITITASHQDLFRFFKALGILKKRIHSVLIVGGGKIAYYLARRLCELNFSVKIIELDYEKCVELSEHLTRVKVIHGDGTDSDLLTQEGIDTVDAFVALTGLDEENIIISMFAQQKKVDKVITKVNRQNLIKMLDTMGHESIVSPKFITASNIVRYVRGRSNSKGSNIRTLYKLVDNMVEAIEFYAADNFSAAGVPLKNLKLRPDLLLVCIVRQNKIIFPRGNDVIERGDNVIVVTTNPGLTDLKDILQ